MEWLNLIFTFIISLFILFSLLFIGRTYQLNRKLNGIFRLTNCGDSGQIFIIRTLQMVLIIFFPLFVLFDELPNLPSVLYLVMHLALFITQIYSTIHITIGTEGFRVGVIAYEWKDVDRCDILSGLHEDNHLYPSGGVARIIIGEKIYRAELKKTQIDEVASFMGKYVETESH
ncbi:hypothetical protein [Pseudalkalibacillus berkeleyi]|uniref:DUF5673 domain-containing protein n=1 Tax=Pseudalkalibacillus berkeleyi TaxID=1069813 RepID=A0ABS9GV77_9BACL|nr:hypothetical protein [Pseudalkalibacillus berkeleyi]MCF6136738.1 hypothetical protein [Pseudalkalibacillus berkeleyi]